MFKKWKLFCTICVTVCYSRPWILADDQVTEIQPVQNVTYQTGGRQSRSTCTKSQFACRSLDCIEKSKLCNGAKDCEDGSDETVSSCQLVECPDHFFKCNYGACIDAALKCNGRGDCADNSDETNTSCTTNSSSSIIFLRKCRANEWRCKTSGKCILSRWKCNGKKDCEDGSDELVQVCKPSAGTGSNSTILPLQERSTISPSTKASTSIPTQNGCKLPNGPERAITLTDRNDTWLNASLFSEAPKLSKIQVFCNPDYALPSGEKVQVSVCLHKGQWNPPLRTCLKTCPNLHSEDAVLSCLRDDAEMDCEGELINGTTVRPRCRPLYHSENEVYRELRCLENGQWNGTLPECVPDCGITNTFLQETQNLIFEGKPANASDSPWHVALYRFSGGANKSPVLICGGTLISANIVVSAAHCFFDLGRGVTLNSVADYEVVVSKYTRNYTIIDNGFQKRYKIRELVFTDDGYNPTLTGQFSNDIVALVLKRKVRMNKFVLPACVDWTSSRKGGSRLTDGTPGKLVGWGVDKTKSAGSPILLYAYLPYISFNSCKGRLKQIDTDKFCAGNETGAGARRGDSGGGLMFRDSDSGRYYLRGVVSTTDADSRTSVATFTDISKYVDWLDRVRVRVTKEWIQAAADSAGVCNITHQGPGQKIELFDEKENWLTIPSSMRAPKLSTIEITCNPLYTLGNGNQFQRSTCFLKEKWNPPLKTCLKMCSNLRPANMDLSCYLQGKKVDCNGELVSGTRVRPSCKIFYHSDRKVDYRELTCLETGKWDNDIFECEPDCGISPTISEQPSLTLSDSPWNVAIYKREDGSVPTLQCSGTLISPDIIVSAANCFYDHNKGIALNSPQDYEIVVSKFTKDYSTINNAFQRKYEIRNIMFTLDDEPYDPHTLRHTSHNIVALVTKKPVQLNKYVLPACTDWTAGYLKSVEKLSAEDLSYKLVGWAWGANTTQNLLHKQFSGITPELCSLSINDLDKICMKSGAATSKTYSGEGLMLRDPLSERYFLRGISGRATTRTNLTENVAAFTDISRHVKWLKGIYDSTQEGETIYKECQVPDNGPVTEPNKRVVLSDDNDNPLNISSGLKAPKFSKIMITCLANHSLSNGEKIQRSVCAHRDEWNPPLRPCLKSCSPLRSVNMNISCFRDDAAVDCNSDMIYGTRVRPECKQYFRREKSGLVSQEMSCRANGEWDQELFECVPDCGIPKTAPAQPPSTTDWVPAQASDAPWNVAIYKVSPTDGHFRFWCSGTLISANMIVSVAYRFYDSKRRVPLNSTADYKVIVSKYTSDYDTIDNDYQKSYTIREMIFTDNGYSPTTVRLNDIVVLVLETPVQMDANVFPACVEWNPKTSSGSHIVDGSPGNLVGWMNTTNITAQILYHTQLPFISFRQCSKKFGFIDTDRFCAGYNNGHTLQSGIGGGGLVFRDPSNERYFLRGVWSGRSSNNKVNIGTFTDVSKHIHWLKRVRDRLERESLVREQQTSDVLIIETADEWDIVSSPAYITETETTDYTTQHQTESTSEML